MLRSTISIIAHRGASHEAPENTLKSFQKAITLGADYIEFDVHRSRDGIVVIHDEKLKRTTGCEGLVKDFTTGQLSEMDAGEGEHIPTLEEVIQFCKGKIHLQIEVKDAGIAPELIDTLSRNNILDQVLISSFIHDELSIIKDINFYVPCATLDPTDFAWINAWVQRTGIIRNTKGRQLDGIHPFHMLVNDRFVRMAHAAGLFVHPWTVDDPTRMQKLLKCGVDGIITNEPRQLLGILVDLGLPKKEYKTEH